MIPHRGVWDEKTKRGYNHTNLPDEVAKRLLKEGKYEDRIMLIEDYELLKRPNYADFLAFRVDAEEKKLTLASAFKAEKARLEAKKDEKRAEVDEKPVKDDDNVQESGKV